MLCDGSVTLYNKRCADRTCLAKLLCLLRISSVRCYYGESNGENSNRAEQNLHDNHRRWGEVGEWNYSPLFCGVGLPLTVAIREINESSRS